MGSKNMRWLLVFLAFTLLFDHVISEDNEEDVSGEYEDEDLSAEDEEDDKDDEEEYDEEGSKEGDHDDEYYDEEYDEEYDKHNDGGHEPLINHHTTLEEAKHWWKKLSPGARKKIAEEEYIKNEEDKRFQIYLKALILEAEKIG